MQIEFSGYNTVFKMSLRQEVYTSVIVFWRMYTSLSYEIGSCTQSGNTHSSSHMGKTGGVSFHQGKIFAIDLKPETTREKATRTTVFVKAKHIMTSKEKTLKYLKLSMQFQRRNTLSTTEMLFFSP